MNAASKRTIPPRYLQELTLQEQVHVALGSATTLEEFYLILGCVLVDPNIFAFSRAFILCYDSVTQTYTGRLAVGALSRKEHDRMRAEIAEEDQRLFEQIATAQAANAEPRILQQLYNLRFHSLWIHLMQEQEGSVGLNQAFQQVTLLENELPENHLVRLAAQWGRAQIVQRDSVDTQGLNEFLRFPLLAGHVVTKRGLHAVVFADRAFEKKPINSLAQYHFQWLLNHASVTLDNVELLEELRQSSERLKEVDRIKTNFLSIVSHELRTPLTAILGFVQILRDKQVGPLTPFQEDLLNRVAQQSAHLASLVHDILEVAEVEAGGMLQVELTAVDPLTVVMHTTTRVEERRKSKGVVIETLVEEAIPFIRTDPNALERILYHLLDNAIKFSPTNGRVRIYFRQHDGQLHITIEDNGIGISPENLRKIFDYFYQVDFRLERAYGGMGLGLTIVKLLLDATGGQIRVESAVGSGSRFTVSFPIVESPALNPEI